MRIRPTCQGVHLSARSFVALTESSAAYELSNVVEMALKKALLLAAEGSVETVGKIAAELEARQPERFAGQNAAHAMRDANYLATGRSS